MKQIKFLFIALAGVLFGCQQAELSEPTDMGAVNMKTVTISAMMDVTDTKASLDSETGAFTWQSGDVLSVLATDGKFYDFILDGEAGKKEAEFKGEIPENAEITTVATYPAIVANGTENTVFVDGILNYVLPAAWDYAEGVTNVPMVATFGVGEPELMSFKHVGGVMRFPVKNLPKEAKFIVSMNNKTVTGQFPVDITALGESCMEAGTTASEVVINYTSDVDYANVEFNVPVPTGTYDNFTVTIKDAAGTILRSKIYTLENKVNRATLLNMSEIALDEPFVDNGIGTEPDNTNYDVYGLGELPIDYWQDIPSSFHNWDHEKMLEEYQKVKDCGMNIMHFFGWGENTLEKNKKLLKVAEELGMKYIGLYEEDGFDTDVRINNIKEHLASSPAYIGEHSWGEPEESILDKFASFANKYVKALPGKDPWSVLYPSYYKLNQSTGVIEFDKYVSYVDQFLAKIPARILVYDYYGLGAAPANLAVDYFWNLDFVRERTLGRRMPYGVITQSGRVNANRIPTENDLRWSVFANLTLGAKYISYFCYCNPTDDYSGYTFGKYMVTLQNELTENYYYVQRLNKDIKTIGKKLLYCHADGAIIPTTTYYPLFDNNQKGRTKYGPVQKMTSDVNMVCGCFRDARVSENGENYKGYKVMLVSAKPGRDDKAYLTLDSSVDQITVTINNESKTLQITNTLNETVEGVTFSHDGAKLTVAIPDGSAALIEF